MPKKASVVRIISVSTAAGIVKDLRTMSLEKAGRRHGIKNTETIPRLVRRAYERAGRRVPALLSRLQRTRKPDTVVRVGKRGTLIIPKEAVVDSFGFSKGGKFAVRRRGGKIVLTSLG